MNKCNYINSLGTTKHMFVIVKPLTNQVIVNFRSIGNARFFKLVLKFIFGEQLHNTYILYTICVGVGTLDYQLQRKWNPYENTGEVLEQTDIKLIAEYFDLIGANIRAF